MKKTWTIVKEVLNKHSNEKEFLSYFIMEDKTDIANQFSTFFANIGPDFSSKIPKHKTNIYGNI